MSQKGLIFAVAIVRMQYTAQLVKGPQGHRDPGVLEPGRKAILWDVRLQDEGVSQNPTTPASASSPVRRSVVLTQINAEATQEDWQEGQTEGINATGIYLERYFAFIHRLSAGG